MITNESIIIKRINDMGDDRDIYPEEVEVIEKINKFLMNNEEIKNTDISDIRDYCLMKSKYGMIMPNRETGEIIPYRYCFMVYKNDKSRSYSIHTYLLYKHYYFAEDGSFIFEQRKWEPL